MLLLILLARMAKWSLASLIGNTDILFLLIHDGIDWGLFADSFAEQAISFDRFRHLQQAHMG
jgi:hypothetical protein